MILLLKANFDDRYQRLLERRAGGDPAGMAAEDKRLKNRADLHDGHGHVRPLPGGIKARCGGPSRCSDCNAEAEKYGTPVRLDGWALPSFDQIAAGNYKKPRLKWHGLSIAIENPVGTVREGVDETGAAWRTEFKHAYGEISNTIGADGDAVDVFMGPDESADQVYIVRQMKRKKWDQFDEDKCFLNFQNMADAKAAYLGHYDDPRFYGSIIAMPVAEFVVKVRATAREPGMLKSIIFIRGRRL